MESVINKEYLLQVIETLRLLYSKFDTKEPIPNYTEKEIDELFNCIERIYQGYLETTMERIASALFNITKNHYLSNGNKRIAVIITGFLLFEEIPNINLNFSLLEKIVLKIAEGTISSKEETLHELKLFLN